MTAERTLAIVVFVLSGLLLTRLAPPAIRVWRIYHGTRSRRQQDARGSAPLPSPAVADRLDVMREQGFERLGETFVDLPAVGRRYAWQLVHESRTIYAAIVPSTPIGALIAIYSAWPDGTWLSTMYPIGETAEAPDFVVQAVRSSPQDAVARHLARQGQLRARHGANRTIETMTDLLALDAAYRSRHGGRTLLRRSTRIILPALIAATLTVVAVVLLLVSAR